MIDPFKKGFMTEDERKAVQTYETNNDVQFVYRQDLSGIVEVRIVEGENFNERLASAMTEFIGMWMLLNYPHLNGFSGFDTIKYRVEKYV
jgi:hypothetical protein